MNRLGQRGGTAGTDVLIDTSHSVTGLAACQDPMIQGEIGEQAREI